MKSWRPWESLFDEIEDKEELNNMLHFKIDNPFSSSYETFENMRNNRPIRKATAGVHPEDTNQ